MPGFDPYPRTRTDGLHRGDEGPTPRWFWWAIAIVIVLGVIGILLAR